MEHVHTGLVATRREQRAHRMEGHTAPRTSVSGAHTIWATTSVIPEEEEEEEEGG
jgi:hypothetical protein